MRRIAVANKKGGVGKTTTAVNLAAALAEGGHRVLLVDLGPQRNATSTLCPPDLMERTNHLAKVMTGDLPVEDAVVNTALKGLQLLPASVDMEALKLKLQAMPGGIRRLRRAFRNARPDLWDFVIMDCPPTIETLTVSGIVAAGEVLVVLEPGAYAIDGLEEITRDIAELKDVLEIELRLLGVLFNKVDGRTRISREVRAWMDQELPNIAFATNVPHTVSIAEAAFRQGSIFQHKPHSSGATAFRELANEVVVRGEAA